MQKFSEFDFNPSKWIPFKDKNVINRVLRIKREEIANHPNPDLKISVVPDNDIEFIWVTDMFRRIQHSAMTGEKLVMILPNPCPLYRHVARLINSCKTDCRNLFVFAMDEYADENGNIAPPDWKFGFSYAMLNYLYYAIDERLRPPKNHFVGFTNQNLSCYGRMIEDAGGADICYSGPGWTGHLAFIEPDAPEFMGPLHEWEKMSARICTLSPFTIAQNSLHGSFGKSGNLAAVPPKAATIGPAEVIGSRHRVDFHSITINGTASSWQRFVSRLILHGPVTPLVPESILQNLKTDVFISETIAQDINPDWETGY